VLFPLSAFAQTTVNPQVGIGAYQPPTGGGGGGSGTVTSVSVVSTNGFAGSVATSTVTPAITLKTTVTGLLLGNGTSVSAATAGTDYQAPITLTTTGTSGAATFSGGTLNIPQYSGGGGSVSLTAGNTGIVVSPSPITGTGTISLGNPTASTLGGVESIAAVTSNWVNSISTSGVPSLSQPDFTDISGNFTLAQFPSIATLTVLGNVTGGSAVPTALTATQLTTLPNVFTSSLQGLVPASGGGTTNFLRADGTFAAPAGAGGVTSVTGDTTIFNNSTSTGAVTLTKANAAAGTFLGNNTTSAAAPAYIYDALIGTNIITGAAVTTVLTAASAGFQVINTTGTSPITLPTASTCPGKEFQFTRPSASGSVTVSAAAGDTITNTINTTGNIAISPSQFFRIKSDGVSTWRETTPTVLPLISGGLGLTAATNGAILSAASSSPAYSLVGTAGQLPQSAGTLVPTFTSAPGAGLTGGFTSVTTQKDVSSGTSPTISGGATLGTGSPTIGFVGTAHDESGQITILAGVGVSNAIATVTYGNAAYAAAPNVTIFPANANAAGLIAQEFVSSQSTTAFALTLGALVSGQTYIYNYIVKQ